ncbi:hypothetical protein SUGI_0607810 [Cryptomeria japonica]|uniref:actin-related protein 7 isoform X2 n=1 Tax=Cryptomeria japonica TaxID=3369 RepID=UPI0024149567|nr:actin-related protein 7 isoform X2 [Cryptomeria japonica]GLJ30689.1 hypothetical protein SUGI_0607810 [Cryptomeria japonica]
MEAVVIDAGSKLLKAGLALPDQEPSMIIPTKMQGIVEDDEHADKTDPQDITVDPIVRGIVKNWDAMEDLLHYVLYTRIGWEIGNEGQVLFADPILTPKAIREQLVQLMFETFNVNGFYATEQAVLSLYAVGRISGCAVDVGHGKIDIAPVWEGAVQHNASKKFEVGGIDLTELFARELQKSNPQINIDLSIVEMLKETYAYTAEDQGAYEEKQRTFHTEKHTLPDGQVISLGKERYTVGEVLFQPSLLGIEEYGIVEQLIRCASCAPFENQRQLLENTVLCGGTATMSGFDDRFQKEAILASPSSIRPALVKPPEYMPENMPKSSAWMGGAILAKVVFPQNQHITKAEYDESGPSIVHRKCF